MLEARLTQALEADEAGTLLILLRAARGGGRRHGFGFDDQDFGSD